MSLFKNRFAGMPVALLCVVLLCVGTGFVYFSRPNPDVSTLRPFFERIENGMSLREVEAIVGRPCDWTIDYDDGIGQWWLGENYMIVVHFDATGVIRNRLIPGDHRPRPPSLLDRLRKWFSLPNRHEVEA